MAIFFNTYTGLRVSADAMHVTNANITNVEVSFVWGRGGGGAGAAYIMSFWSSATEPKRDSCRRCQDTSSTTAVWPVKMVLASTILPSLGTVLMSHRQIVWTEEDVDGKHEQRGLKGKGTGTVKITDGKGGSVVRAHMVVRRAEQTATQVGVPREAVALLLVAPETQVRSALSRGVWNQNKTEVSSGMSRAIFYDIFFNRHIMLAVIAPGLEGCFV